MKIPRLIAVAALISCGQTILAMDMNKKITELLERIPTEDIITSDLPQELFDDLPNPSRASAADIIEKQSHILHRYLTLKGKFEKYGCTLPYDANRKTLKEQRLTTALTGLDTYYQQFIRKIREHGADTSFLEQAKRLNIHDDNVSPTLAKNRITSKWALVEAINSAGRNDTLLTLPLQGILQSYKLEAPLRAQWIQRALDKVEREQDELKRK